MKHITFKTIVALIALFPLSTSASPQLLDKRQCTAEPFFSSVSQCFNFEGCDELDTCEQRCCTIWCGCVIANPCDDTCITSYQNCDYACDTSSSPPSSSSTTSPPTSKTTPTPTPTPTPTHRSVVKCAECEIAQKGCLLAEGVAKGQDNVQVVAEICAAVAAITALEVELGKQIPGVAQLAKLCIEAVIDPKVGDLVIGLLVKTCANKEVKSAISQCIARNCE